MAREALIERNTKETQIRLQLNIDGTGSSDIDTGIGFFDHMLDGFTRHGLYDLTLRVHGDLNVDDHHTIEDTGIVLGNAIREAVGDKKGIKRYGSCILPMDEVLVLCAVDLSGRPYLGWDAEFPTEKIGDMATEMVKGKTIEEAMQVTNKAVMEALDGLPPVKVHCSLLAEEAIHAALWDYAEKHDIKIEGLKKPKSDIHEGEEAEEEEY